MDALRSNSNLERLDLVDLYEKGNLDALAAALLENTGLVYLGLEFCRLDESSFCEFVRAISTHPSLIIFDLTHSDFHWYG
jgi:hypothetical protein